MANQIAREKYMPIAIEQTLQALQIMVQSVPVGTNLALLHLMWSIRMGLIFSQSRRDFSSPARFRLLPRGNQAQLASDA